MVGVACQAGLDVFDIFAVLKAEAGIGKAEIVKADRWTACGFACGAEMPAQHILVVDMVPCVIREDHVLVILRAS